ILPLHDSMEQPHHYKKVLIGVFLLIGIVYSSFGLICYFKLGYNTPEMITESIGGGCLVKQNTLTQNMNNEGALWG
ncbi:MAG: hypothetical protein EZS28_036245, partial [Streblomastix strix]